MIYDNVIITTENLIWDSDKTDLPSEVDDIPRWVIPKKEFIKKYLEEQFCTKILSFTANIEILEEWE